MSEDADRRKQCMEVLELPEDASMLEIKTAYQHLKDLYTKGSIAISPIEDDYPEGAREEIISKIDEAYTWLATHYRKTGEGTAPKSDDEATRASNAARQEVSAIDEFDGPTLRRIREMLGIDIGEVEFSTKISLQHIRNIEEDKFRFLPEEVFVKGYLSAYAKCLGLEAPKVVEQYMEKYRRGR